MAETISLEKVIQHHLSQNIDQKLSPHLVAGLTILLAQDIRNKLAPAPAPAAEPQSPEVLQ